MFQISRKVVFASLFVIPILSGCSGVNTDGEYIDVAEEGIAPENGNCCGREDRRPRPPAPRPGGGGGTVRPPAPGADGGAPLPPGPPPPPGGGVSGVVDNGHGELVLDDEP